MYFCNSVNKMITLKMFVSKEEKKTFPLGNCTGISLELIPSNQT